MDKKLIDIGEFGLINKIAGQFKTDKSVIKIPAPRRCRYEKWKGGKSNE